MPGEERTRASETRRGNYWISTDRERLDLALIHDFLSGSSYWAKGRSRERVERAIRHSVPFGLYHDLNQAGFARVVTDYVTFALLADVFVLPAHRGQGLGVWLVQTVTSQPEFEGVRRWHLGTRDAHGLYRRFGFVEPAPGTYLDRLDPEADSRG
jgi:GNAT superfamily N-acetyltransferase